MPIQITIIGLGQIGASIGMALAQHKNIISTVGHDIEISVERAAQKKGAVEKTEHNLPKAVKDARIVLLALPVHQVRETLEFIASDLIDGTVVIDTAPIKSEVAKWAQDLLPEGSYYVGLVPTVGPEFLHETGTGLDSAKADLFSKSIFLVDSPPGTPGEAVELVSDLVKLFGATAMLTDIVESDGLMVSTHLLPQLVSVALLNATVDQPGWKDGRKLAGRAFIAATSAMQKDDAESLQMLALHNRDNVTRSLNLMIASLHALRDDIEKGNDEGVKDRMQSAQEGRTNWLNERTSANWVEMQREPTDYPSVNERLFGGLVGRRTKNKK
ncbi:MAG: prephenate dehydrogenase [Anaerolineales bacterium]|nr:prephenate dehydrogenase [Anaerolineales bacterium]